MGRRQRKGDLLERRKAMPDGARLVVIERLMPERAADDPAAIMLDLHMMMISGGRARTVPRSRRCWSAAGLKISNVAATGSGLALITAMT